MWILLLKDIQISRGGTQKKHRKGTQIDLGGMDAQRLINEGAARAVNSEISIDVMPDDAGIVAVSDINSISCLSGKIAIVTGPPRLEFPRTLIYYGGFMPRADLMPVGFKLLERWQMVIPLWSYTELACHVGSEDERARTQAIVRDLRVPLYDTRLMFVSRCDETQELIELWVNEMRSAGADEKLAFLRAAYKIKPTICAQPISWVSKESR